MNFDEFLIKFWSSNKLVTCNGFSYHFIIFGEEETQEIPHYGKAAVDWKFQFKIGFKHFWHRCFENSCSAFNWKLVNSDGASNILIGIIELGIRKDQNYNCKWKWHKRVWVIINKPLNSISNHLNQLWLAPITLYCNTTALHELQFNRCQCIFRGKRR